MDHTPGQQQSKGQWAETCPEDIFGYLKGPVRKPLPKKKNMVINRQMNQTMVQEALEV